MADAEKKEETEPPKKSKKMLFIIVGVAVLAAAGGGAFFMLGGKEPPPADGTVAAAPAVDESVGLVPMDTFLVNLSDQNGERYMKLTLRLSVSPESKADAIKDDELLLARVRDRILTTLMYQTASDLGDPLGKEGLRREIQAQLDTLLEGGQVKDVLFSEFVVQ